MRIAELFEKGLEKYLNEFSSVLGDRTEYLGASDIPQCVRRVVMSKLYPEKVKLSTETLVKLARGHLAEGLLVGALSKTGVENFDTQVEVTHPEYEFIKAHIDLMFTSKNSIGIIEQKSVSEMPNEPYSHWVEQLQLQMGLLKELYPDKEIRGAIFCVNLNTGEYKFFNGFVYNEALYSALIERAKKIWTYIREKRENVETEESSLCAFCPFKKDCPIFSGDDAPEPVKELVKEYKHAAYEEKVIKSKKEGIKDKIIELVGKNYTAKFDGNSLTIKETKSKRVDSKKLQQEYPDVYESVIKVINQVYFRIA